MKVVFVSYDFPYPTTSGGKTRAYNLIKRKDSTIELHLFSFIRKNFDNKYIDDMKKIGVKSVTLVKRNSPDSPTSVVRYLHPTNSIFHKLYFNKENEQKLLDLVRSEKIDIVHFESYYTGFYISDKLSTIGVKQIFGTENIEANVYEDFIKTKVAIPLRPFYTSENYKIRIEEEKMMRKADISLAVTPSEKKYIENISGKNAVVIENGVDIDKFGFKTKHPKEKVTILFVGSFSYHPNVDAITYFYNNIFTKLDSGKYQLKIVGKNANKLAVNKAENVLITEYVEDIVSEYHAADIFVSPVRLGGGTNFKLLEAMAVGLPVVAFANRLSDLGVISHKELLIAHTDQEFVKHIEELSVNTKKRLEIAKHAREFIEQKYSWDVIGKKMNDVWKGLA